MIPKEIFKKVRKLDIRTKRLVNDIFSGEYQSIFKGKGMDFSEVREYQIGDDIRTIDWNVTARMGHPYVKLFEEERELIVILLVDMSSSFQFGTVKQLKGDIAIEICALLAFSAIQNNDKAGLIIFTDKIEKFVPPKKGKTHVLRILRELFYFKPENMETNIGVALEYLLHIMKRRAIVFLVSDFKGKDYEKPLKIASKKHDIIPITITDPRELQMSDFGFIELVDAETGEEIIVDTRDKNLREKFSLNVKDDILKRTKLFKSIGLDYIDISTDKSYIEPLVSFFKRRALRY